MTTSTARQLTDTALTQNTRPLDVTITRIGDQALRYSVVVVLAWIGAMKFSAYEAGAIQGLVASSPLTSWLYNVFSLQGASNLIGTVEIATAAAILLAPLHRHIAVVGSLAAIATFAVTSSFLLTAPVWEASLGGFPALNVVPGQFLLKDIVLLAAAISLLGKALSSSK
ncbi:TPA: DUF417 family protein [Pseudomonas aeruginosa]|uniref:YkgB family protein n=1 Tax=Vibrio TaxID=662 RepID=UPI001BD2E546|nr:MULTISPECIES: DUF417 family protein [Vibrio]MDF5462633.1 DUF417 family protein [Vibrio parahaemolyticus]HCF4213568.1 DUF417 family protein [Pseudomonas aeruginosa]MBS9878477.1 DUF417 family protein [Vibrio alginolyticus]MDW1939370.1 DUF417 family protein [Vibrio sp. 818]MDW1985459.1 DUF417 family protein [Vibrio sp. 811]